MNRHLRHCFTAAGVTLFASAGLLGQNPFGDSDPSGFRTQGGGLAPFIPFAADNDIDGQEPYRLEPATLQYSRIKDINPGSGSSLPREFVFVFGLAEFLFVADDGSGRAIWRTDGTDPGTVAVPSGGGSGQTRLTVVGDQVFFSAADAEGRELWVTDGATSTQVEDIRPGVEGSDPRQLIAFDGMLFFTADDGVHGRELWCSDGVTATMVADLVTGIGSCTPSELVVAGGRLFFAGNSDDCGRELYVVASAVSAPLLLDVNTEPDGSGGTQSSSPTRLAGSTLLYFTAFEPASGRELHVSNGTSAGTVRVTDIHPGPAGARIRNVVPGPNLFDVWFVADDGSGPQLWSALGQTSAQLTDLVDVEPSELQVISGGRAVFRGTPPSRDRELWVTDGTPLGTQLLVDIKPGVKSSNLRDLRRIPALGAWASGGSPPTFDALFVADDDVIGVELWSTNGTIGGTGPIGDIAVYTGSKQPDLVTHTDGTGSQLEWCIEGDPLALAGLALDVSINPGVPLPLPSVGLYLLGGSPVIVTFGVLDPDGVLSFPLAVPPGTPDTLLAGQAFQLDMLAGFLLSNLSTAGIASATTSSLGSGAVGVYDDRNHLYEIAIEMPASVESGCFEFRNGVDTLEPEGGQYTQDEGPTIKLEGSLPGDWTGQVELYFRDGDDVCWFVWQSYC